MIELLLESFLVYHSPMFEAWKVPKRLVEVSCDVTLHLVAYRTAVDTRTTSSGMRTHTGQYSQLPCMLGASIRARTVCAHSLKLTHARYLVHAHRISVLSFMSILLKVVLKYLGIMRNRIP